MNQNLYSDDDRQYLQMMQDNISRMASNSANCKTWVVTLVAGIFAIGASVTQLNLWFLLTIIPILMFWYLDTFYLHLERGMRNRQKDFLNKAKACESVPEGLGAEETEAIQKEYALALYNFAPLTIKNDDASKGLVSTADRFFSKSTAPFYGTILVCVFVILIIVNCGWAKSILEWVNGICCCNA